VSVISAVSVSSVTQPVRIAPVSASTSASASIGSGASQFAASYAPQVYAVYLNGITMGISSGSVLENDVYAAAVTQPGNSPPEIPSLPPIDGAQQVIHSLMPLAGTGRIFSGSGQTVAAGTGAVQSSASHSSAHVASR